jgi:uncharacterized protein (TIGR02598 family)
MKSSRSPSSGFSLVEVVVALAITSFCLLTLLGLLSVGTLSNASSLDQTTATNIAAGIAADLHATPLTATSSPRYQISLPTSTTVTTYTLFLDNNGTVSGTGNASANAGATNPPLYRATLTFTPPATAGVRTATFVRIQVTWPGLSDPTVGTAPSKFIGSFDTVIALDRN